MRQFLEFVTACPRLPHGGLAVKTNVAQIIPSFFIGNRDTHDITMMVHENMKCAADCISAALGLFFSIGVTFGFWEYSKPSQSRGLAAAEIAVVPAQPKGSLPRAHTCTNEFKPQLFPSVPE